jgi:hypothetical protein
MKQESEELAKAQNHIERLRKKRQTLKRNLELVGDEKDEERLSLMNKGVSSEVQACYTGVEALLEAALKSMGIHVPNGEAFHKNLLERAVDAELLTTEQKSRLDEIRALRHKIRHDYDMALDIDILRERAESFSEILPSTLVEIEKTLDRFFTSASSNATIGTPACPPLISDPSVSSPKSPTVDPKKFGGK